MLSIALCCALHCAGLQVRFAASSSSAIAEMRQGGVSVLVTNLGRSRPDSGLLLIEDLNSLGFAGVPKFVYSKSAMADNPLKLQCLTRGAVQVFGNPEEAEAVLLETLQRLQRTKMVHRDAFDEIALEHGNILDGVLAGMRCAN